MSEVVTVEISPIGEVSVKTQGFTGATCKQATKALEAALGSTIQDDHTREFHQGAACTLPQHQQAGQ